MAVREIIKFPDKRLRLVSEPVKRIDAGSNSINPTFRDPLHIDQHRHRRANRRFSSSRQLGAGNSVISTNAATNTAELRVAPRLPFSEQAAPCSNGPARAALRHHTDPPARRWCPSRPTRMSYGGPFNNSPIAAALKLSHVGPRSCGRECRFYFSGVPEIFPTGFAFYFFRANISKGDRLFSKLPRNCELDSVLHTFKPQLREGSRNVPTIPFDYSFPFSL
jgi:hypothetical protein